MNETDSQSACIISNYGENQWLDDFYLESYPSNRIGCQHEEESFIEQVRVGATQGCAVRKTLQKMK